MSLFFKYFDTYLMHHEVQQVEDKAKTWMLEALILLRLAMKFNETQLDMFTDKIKDENSPPGETSQYNNIH